MIKVKRHLKAWLAAPAAMGAVVLGLAAPALAQPGQSSPATKAPRPIVSSPTTSTQSLQSLVAHAPIGGKRWIVNDPVAYAQALKSGKWVRTPSGLSYTGCVFYVPNEATVRNGLIILPSGASHQLKPCQYPTLAYPGAGRSGATRRDTIKPEAVPAGGPCFYGSGGHWWAVSCYGTAPDWVNYMSQEYAVPTDPAKVGALIFIWGGLENSSGNTLLQDVLTWGANPPVVTNANIWYVTPWYLWSGNSVYGNSIHVAPSDTILASLTASNCNSSGNCAWDLSSTDENNGKSAYRDVTSGASFDVVLGAVLEVPRADGCVEMPANGHAAFRDLNVSGNDGNITPHFGISYPDPQCSVSMNQSPTGADILWKP